MILAACVALLGIAIPAHATFPGTNGKIAFWSGRGPAGIYTMNPDGSNQTNLTAPSSPLVDSAPAWSPDGRQIAFSRNFGLNSTAIYVMNADGSNPVLLVNAAYDNRDPTWSPDGQKIAFARDGLYVMSKDGTGETRITSTAAEDPSWSPDGTRIAFRSWSSDGISVIDADGTNQHLLVSDVPFGDHFQYPNWLPDGSKIVVSTIVYRGRPGTGAFYTVDPVTGTMTRVDSFVGSEPVFSPDGAKIAYSKDMAASGTGGNLEIFSANVDGTGISRLTDNGSPGPSGGGDGFGPVDNQLDWQSIPATYVRPRGASPFVVSLVPAYDQCTASNSTHGSPLAYPSCSPPTQASTFLTVGTPDATGAGADMVGAVGMKVKPSSPEDVLISANVTDVRCKAATSGSVCNGANTGPYPDYSGELQAVATIRMTDHYNGAGLNEAATVQDIPFPIGLTCSNTSDTSTGGVCNVVTSGQVVCPECGVKEGQRTVVALDQMRVYDGGADGQTATAGNTLFLDQGIFIP